MFGGTPSRYDPVATSTLVGPSSPTPNVFLSDLSPTRNVVGWGGSARRDRSIQGGSLTVFGMEFERGLGAHADSESSIPSLRLIVVSFRSWGSTTRRRGKGSSRSLSSRFSRTRQRSLDRPPSLCARSGPSTSPCHRARKRCGLWRRVDARTLPGLTATGSAVGSCRRPNSSSLIGTVLSNRFEEKPIYTKNSLGLRHEIAL